MSDSLTFNLKRAILTEFHDSLLSKIAGTDWKEDIIIQIYEGQPTYVTLDAQFLPTSFGVGLSMVPQSDSMPRAPSMMGVVTANEIDFKIIPVAFRRLTEFLLAHRSDPCNADSFAKTEHIELCRTMNLHLENKSEDLSETFEENGLAGVECGRILMMRFLRALPEKIVPVAFLQAERSIWRKRPREIYKMVNHYYRPQYLTVVQEEFISRKLEFVFVRNILCEMFARRRISLEQLDYESKNRLIKLLSSV